MPAPARICVVTHPRLSRISGAVESNSILQNVESGFTKFGTRMRCPQQIQRVMGWHGACILDSEFLGHQGDEHMRTYIVQDQPGSVCVFEQTMHTALRSAAVYAF